MGIECFRVEFPKGMDAKKYARRRAATKLFGLLLNRATWLGKGARPAGRVQVPVIVPEPSDPVAAPHEAAAPAAEEPAAKEKISLEKTPEPGPPIEPESQPEPAAEPVNEPIISAVSSDPPQQQESVFSLAAEAAPVAPMPPRSNAIDAPVEMRGEDIVQRYGDREYRVRGLQKNTSPDSLQVNLRVLGVNARGDMALHVDKLDLEAARQRVAFISRRRKELGVKEERPSATTWAG